MMGRPPHPPSADALGPSLSREGRGKSDSGAAGGPSPLAGEGGAQGAPGEGEVARARSLRRHMTDAERKLWRALRSRQFQAVKFRRQVPVGPYVADVLAYDRRLVVEVDGGHHAGSAYDVERDRWLSANGFRVLRLWNNDVLDNLDGALTVIAEALRENR